MDKSRLPLRRAAAEFLVIFIGVTVSLLADDWREAQKARDQERVALLEMVEDLRADSIAMEAVLQRATQWDEACLWLLRSEARAEVPADSLLSAISALNFIMFFQPVRAAYESLQGGGELGLIQDPEIRRMATIYYEVEQLAYESYLRRGTDEYYLWTARAQDGIVKWAGSDEARSLRDPSGVPALRVGWEEISQRAELFDAAFRLGTWAGSMVIRHRDFSALNRSLIERIETHLAG